MIVTNTIVAQMAILEELGGVLDTHPFHVGDEHGLVVARVGVQPCQHAVDDAARRDDHQQYIDDKRILDQSNQKITHFISRFRCRLKYT